MVCDLNILLKFHQSGTGTIDAASQTTNKSSIEISDKGKDKTATQESDICHQEKGNLPIMQSCPVDSSTERSPACVAPSPTHSVLRNGNFLLPYFSVLISQNNLYHGSLVNPARCMFDLI